jgi:hypothetical protein
VCDLMINLCATTPGRGSNLYTVPLLFYSLWSFFRLLATWEKMVHELQLKLRGYWKPFLFAFKGILYLHCLATTWMAMVLLA